MNKSLKIKTAALLASLLSLVVFLMIFLGPLISLFEIRRGIESGNQVLMERFIDFGTLQDNVKLKMRRQASQTLGFEEVSEDSLMARFAMNIADQIIDMAVENVISAEGLSLMLDGSDLNDLLVPKKKGRTAPRLSSGTEQSENGIWQLWKSSELDFKGLDKAVVTFSVEGVESENENENSRPVKLVFLRHGMIWKLSDFNPDSE